MTDLKRLPEDEVMQLASQVQHLRYYLAASGMPTTNDDPVPASMEDYGFTSPSQLLDLCSAVRLFLATFSSCFLTGLDAA